MALTNREPQIGGTHYGEHDAVQPIDLIEAMSLSFHEGSAVKYVARYHNTRNPDDLRKAQWYIDRLLQLTPEPAPDPDVLPAPAKSCGPQCNEQHTYVPGKCEAANEIIGSHHRMVADAKKLIQVTVNECEDDASAARRFAGYIVRLQKDLEAMGYTMPKDSPVDEAAIDAALMIAQNCKHNHQVPDPF